MLNQWNLYTEFFMHIFCSTKFINKTFTTNIKTFKTKKDKETENTPCSNIIKVK